MGNKLTDLDGNGVPDYEETWFWRGVLGFTARVLTLVTPSHTIAYRAAREYLDRTSGRGE